MISRRSAKALASLLIIGAIPLVVDAAEVSIQNEHRFKLTWLSDSELQYTMPDGEVRTYRQQ